MGASARARTGGSAHAREELISPAKPSPWRKLGFVTRPTPLPGPGFLARLSDRLDRDAA